MRYLPPPSPIPMSPPPPPPQTTTRSLTTDTVNSCSSLIHMSEHESSSIINYDKSLPEDVLIDIFFRLPLKSIFKYKCISKQWLSFLSNPVLMNRKLDSMTPSRPWSLFFNIVDSATKKAVSIASPDPHFQFISDNDGFMFRFLYSVISPLYLLASSNGLVLCSNSIAFQRSYYICNPLTRKWVSLPPPPQTPCEWVLNGIICESSSSSLASTSYKLVRIHECKAPPKIKFDLDIFSSDIGKWNTYKVSCPQEITLQYPFLSSVVCCNGSLYWIEGQNRIIAYNLNNKNDGSECRLINLPDIGRRDFYGYLWELKGAIIYSQCQFGELSVWILEDCLNRRWVWRLIHKIEMKNILLESPIYSWIQKTAMKHISSENPVISHLKSFIASKLYEEFQSTSNIIVKPLAFDPVDPNVLILAYAIWIFGYNMRTRSIVGYRHYSIINWNSNVGDVFPFVFTPRSTTLPPSFWSDT